PFSRAWRLTSAILARSTSWCERREAWLLPVLAHADNRRQPIAATDAYPIERFITTSSRMRGTATGRLPASRCHNPHARTSAPQANGGLNGRHPGPSPERREGGRSAAANVGVMTREVKDRNAKCRATTPARNPCLRSRCVVASEQEPAS